MATYWTPVANYVEQELSSESFENAQVTIHGDVWARDAGVSLKLRLWNVTLARSVGESSDVSATDPTDASFVVTLDTGWNTYRLEVGGDTPGADVFAIAFLSVL